MNIILFNGPPGSGKDTAAKAILLRRNELWGTYRFDRMSMPNKRAFAGTFGGTLNEFGDNSDWEHRKEEPSWLLAGKSYRQWQIDFSESFMKLLYGKDVFPRLFIQRHLHRADDSRYTILVPDCGFEIEVSALRSAFPRAGILLLHLTRDGHTFTGDSRSYINPTSESIIEAGGVAFDILYNGGTKEEFEAAALKKVCDFIGKEAPK